jgi:hypothetical protein
MTPLVIPISQLFSSIVVVLPSLEVIAMAG